MKLVSKSVLLALMGAAALTGHTTADAHAHHTLGEHTCNHGTPEMRRSTYGTPLGADSPAFEVRELYRKEPTDAGGRRVAGPAEVFTIPALRRNATLPHQSRHILEAQAAGTKSPIRIKFRTEDLTTSGRYCAAAGNVVSDYDGGTVTCTAQDVLTTSNRNFLINTVLPRVKNVLTSILSVVPADPFLLDNSVCWGSVTVPSADKTSGISDADVVIFVSAGPTSGNTMAWARMCAVDSNTGRPLIVQTNMGPKYLYADRTEANIDMMVRVGVHEILHGLGFSSDYIQGQYFALKNSVVTTTRRGQPNLWMYTGAGVLGMAKEHFDCSTLDGLEFEDEGGSGTAGSHWERRFNYDDVMSPVAGGKMRYSATTFSLLEDSGHYGVDYSKTESVSYMQNAGCGVFTSKCDTEAGGWGRYYCFDTNTDNGYCDANFESIGLCYTATYTADLPSWAQYFTNPRVGGGESGMGYCPTVLGFSNLACSDYKNAMANNTAFAYYFARDSRCFATNTNFYRSSGSGSHYAARCFKSRCPDGNRIEFQVGSSTTWVQCPLDGSAGPVNAPSGYVGTIKCPEAKYFCTPELYQAPPIPPLTRAAFIELATSVTAQSFIDAFRTYYAVNSTDQVVFLRWASDAEVIAMFGIGGDTTGGAHRSFVGAVTTSTTRQVGTFGFEGSTAETALDNLLNDVESDETLRTTLGISAASTVSIEIALSDPEGDNFSGVVGRPTMIAALIMALAVLSFVSV